MYLEGMYGINEDMLFAHMSQDNKSIQAATALAAAATSTEISTGVTQKTMFGQEGKIGEIPEVLGGVLGGAAIPMTAGPLLGAKILGETFDFGAGLLGFGTDIGGAVPSVADLFGGVKGKVEGLLGDKKTKGKVIQLANGMQIDPNQKGSAKYLEEANREALELAKQNMTAEQRKSLESRLNEIVSSGGTYTEAAEAVSKEAAKLGKKNAEEQSKGGDTTVTLVLDPRASSMLSFQTVNTLAKSVTVSGTNVTQPGSVGEAMP